MATIPRSLWLLNLPYFEIFKSKLQTAVQLRENYKLKVILKTIDINHTS
jgi:hypothetical protein